MIVYHYVYRITNLVLKKHYYGCRSCKVTPKNDLGQVYFSSSKDKDFIAHQKQRRYDFRYKVIHIFDNRKDAIRFEIKLHNKFNVSCNANFYNRAKQTSTKFDTTGTASKNKGISFYMIRDDTGNCQRLTKEEYEAKNLNGITKGKCRVMKDGTNILIDSHEYFSNKQDYNHHLNKKVLAINLDTGQTSIVTKEVFESCSNLVGVTFGSLTVINKLTGKKENITCDEYKSNKDKYIHFNNGRKASLETRNKLSNIRNGWITIKYFDGLFKRVRKTEVPDTFEVGPISCKRFLVTSPENITYRVINMNKFLTKFGMSPNLANERSRKKLLNEENIICNNFTRKYNSANGWKFLCLD